MRPEHLDVILERVGAAMQGNAVAEAQQSVDEVDRGFESFEEGTRAEQFRCKALFSGGGSGSGKGFVLDNTVRGLGLRILNSDDVLEALAASPVTRERLQKKRDAKGAEGDITGKGYGRRGAVIDLKTELMGKFVQKELRPYSKRRYKNKAHMTMDRRNGLVFDVTGANLGTIQKFYKELTERGYDCGMIFVSVKIPTAQTRDLKRKRSLGPEEVEKVHIKANANVSKLAQLFGAENFRIVVNENVRGTKRPTAKKDRSLPEAIRSGATMMRAVKGRKAQQQATVSSDQWTINQQLILQKFKDARSWATKWLKRPIRNPVGKAYLASLKEAVAADAGLVEKAEMYVVYRKDGTGFIYEQMFYDQLTARAFARRIKGSVIMDPAKVPDRIGNLSQLGGSVVEGAGVLNEWGYRQQRRTKTLSRPADEIAKALSFEAAVVLFGSTQFKSPKYKLAQESFRLRISKAEWEKGRKELTGHGIANKAGNVTYKLATPVRTELEKIVGARTDFRLGMALTKHYNRSKAFMGDPWDNAEKRRFDLRDGHWYSTGDYKPLPEAADIDERGYKANPKAYAQAMAKAGAKPSRVWLTVANLVQSAAKKMGNAVRNMSDEKERAASLGPLNTILDLTDVSMATQASRSHRAETVKQVAAARDAAQRSGSPLYSALNDLYRKIRATTYNESAEDLDEFFWRKRDKGKFAAKGQGQEPAPRKKVRSNIASDDYAKALAQAKSDPRYKDELKHKLAKAESANDRTGVELTEPAGLVKPGQEGEWKRAKAAASQQYPGMEAKDKDRFYAVTNTIFGSMTGRRKEESMTERTANLLTERMTGIRG